MGRGWGRGPGVMGRHGEGFEFRVTSTVTFKSFRKTARSSAPVQVSLRTGVHLYRSRAEEHWSGLSSSLLHTRGPQRQSVGSVPGQVLRLLVVLHPLLLAAPGAPPGRRGPSGQPAVTRTQQPGGLCAWRCQAMPGDARSPVSVHGASSSPSSPGK